MKRILLSFVAALALLAIPLPANASLGGDILSVRSDTAHLQGALQPTKTAAYTIEEVKAPTGLIVREYVSSAGKVFAVTWQGPTPPDFRQVLGSYFQTFTQALQSQKGRRVSRSRLLINQSGLIVEMGGHIRWLIGRAYLPAMVPSEVPLEEIR